MKTKLKSVIILLLSFLVCINVVFAGYNVGSGNIRVTLLNQDPDPVRAGEIVEVRFKIENNGAQTLNDFIIELIPEYPFSLYSGTTIKNLGKLQGSQDGSDSIIVDWKLRVDSNAIEGENEIKLKYGYWGTDGAIILDNLMIDVEVEEVNFQLGSLETEPTRLVGDTEDAKLSIRAVALRRAEIF